MATLKEYFNKDFNHVLTLNQNLKLGHQESQTEFEIVARIHLDFNANVKYISSYIPATEYTFELCKSLIHNPSWALAATENEQVMSGLVGGSKIDSSELIFSGRMCIYSETALPEPQMTALRREAKRVGIALQFRGPKFAEERTISENRTECISENSREVNKPMKSLAVSPRKGEEFIKTIGQLLTKTLPEQWDEARFNAKGFNGGWEATYFIKDEYANDSKEIPFSLNEDFVENLERLRDVDNVKYPIKSITFHRNGRYNLSYDVPQIRQLGLNEINSGIEELQTTDLKQVGIDVLKKQISAITAGHKKIVPTNINLKLYRGVKWREKPSNVRKLSSPPSSKVDKLHRAGRDGYPLFYCCTDRNAIFFELGSLSKGDKVALSEWNIIDSVLVNHVGYHPEILQNFGSNRECPSWAVSCSSNEFEETDVIIDKFLASEFTRKVNAGKEHLYKISIAIAEQHFHDDIFDGLMYPTVAMKGMADNFAFKPEVINKKLVIKKVEYIRIEECLNDSEYKISVLDFADSFTKDGQIEWKGRRPQWVLREKGETLNIAVENGKWVARNSDGEIVELG